MITANRTIQAGFIGAGNFITAFHLPTALASDIIDIRGIADLDAQRLVSHEKRFRPTYTTTDYHKLLDDPEIDLVFVGTKQELHARMIIESLQANKWVYCEKPMAETAEESEAVLAAERESTAHLAIGFNRRFAPAYLQTKRLMQGRPRPWFINYRLMCPNPQSSGEKDFYATHERILYEGCHILDLICWLLEDRPSRVFMTGDRLLNNCCILEFADGSNVTFMCGSMGSYGLSKESLEVFSTYTAITVSDFVDMRVRGFAGEADAIYDPHRGEHAREVRRFGFDFYETYKVQQMLPHRSEYAKQGMLLEPVRRPHELSFDVQAYHPEQPDLWAFIPDKGWIGAVEHFAQCRASGEKPVNADGAAGALATEIALTLLRSLETGQPIEL